MSTAEDLCALLTQRAAALGVEVVEEPLARTVYGCYDRDTHRIILRPDLPPERRLRVLAHELAHSILHREPRPKPTVPFRPMPPGEEAEAEHTAFLVAALLGLEPEAHILRRTLTAALSIVERLPPRTTELYLRATVPRSPAHLPPRPDQRSQGCWLCPRR